MALLCNGRMFVGAGIKSFGATAHLSSFGHILPSNFTNRIRNISAGQGITDDKVGLPMGYVQKGWMMPQKAGVLSARMYDISITTTGTGLRGLPAIGSATFTIDTNTPSGELIVSGNGTATLTITSNTPLLTASINGAGSATITVSTNTPLLGAIADLIASGAFTIATNTPVIYPINDSSPLRTGSASFTLSGSLTPYALGIMIGTTEESGLTNAGIANSVWNSLLANYQELGSAGEALTAASIGGGGGSTAADIWAYATRTLTSGTTSAFATPLAYKAVTNNQTASDPSAGKMKWNNSTQNLATQIYIDVITDDGIDLTNYLKNMAAGAILYVQDKDDAGKYQRWTINLGTDNTGWITFNVTLITSLGGNIANNAQCIVVYNNPALSSAPTAEQNADAVLTAAQATPIHSNVKKVNDITVIGVGTELNPWNPE